MKIIHIPKYDPFMAGVRKLLDDKRISHSQLIILRNCWKASSKGKPLHFNYLQKATSQSKEDCRWDINELIRAGAIQSPKSSWYWLANQINPLF